MSYDTRARAITSRVHRRLLSQLDESDFWDGIEDELHKSAVDAVNDVYFDGITDDEWLNAALSALGTPCPPPVSV